MERGIPPYVSTLVPSSNPRTDVLIQQSDVETLSWPSCSSHGNPSAQRRPTSRPVARRPFWRAGAVVPRQRTQSRYIYRAAKTNAAIGPEHPADPLRCPFPAIRDAQMPLAHSPDRNTPWSSVISNRTADSMAGSGRKWGHVELPPIHHEQRSHIPPRRGV